MPNSHPTPNPTAGVQDSHHDDPAPPSRRTGTSQDFGDREVSHTAKDLEERGTAGATPSRGTPGHSPEEKRAWNPD